ncbi:MAG: SOS response-associated peptidase [Pseudomonadota bacterium]|nr:SOS response-associated peptidase [Pseudomonadota bacterium]
MCGRDAAFYTWREIHAFSQPLVLTTPMDDPEPRFNRAPTQQGWVLLPDASEHGAATHAAMAVSMRWGLIPFWARDMKVAYSTINARVESASAKPAFRDAWKRRRCLVPASGYYEWRVLADGKTKQPYFVHAADAPVLMFAGLWDRWQGAATEAIQSYSIVTMPAAGVIAEIHDRMPLILPSSLLRDWIYGSADDAAGIALAAPVPLLAFHAVPNAVGNVRNQGPGLIEDLAAG